MKREIFVLDWLIWQRKAKIIKSWEAKKEHSKKPDTIANIATGKEEKNSIELFSMLFEEKICLEN